MPKDNNNSVITIEGYAWKNGVTGFDINLDTMKLREHIPILLSHDKSVVLGKVLESSLKEGGLYVKAELHKQLMDDNIEYSVKENLINFFSVGMRSIDGPFSFDKTETKDGKSIIVYKDVEVFEISVTAVPVNSATDFNVHFSMNSDSISSISKEVCHSETQLSLLMTENDSLKEKQIQLTNENVRLNKELETIQNSIEVETFKKRVDDLLKNNKSKISNSEKSHFQKELLNSIDDKKYFERTFSFIENMISNRKPVLQERIPEEEKMVTDEKYSLANKVYELMKGDSK